jgi:hypothetical protein
VSIGPPLEQWRGGAQGVVGNVNWHNPNYLYFEGWDWQQKISFACFNHMKCVHVRGIRIKESKKDPQKEEKIT